MKICFTGDVFLGGDLLNKPCVDTVQSEVFNNADMRIINLEQAVSNASYVTNKCTLYTDSYATKQLHDLNVSAVNLAHNHIQDKGLDGISETAEHIKVAGIGSFGAGSNLKAASEPYWLNDEIAILGYCEFAKPYLNQIEVADSDKPGVNPLRLEKIYADLDMLPAGKKAILYFHWGMEHVWLPPADDIGIAKTLLEDERVITIIGMHPHRAQGVVTHAGKKAYMCLGNFIFPNFYIAPPTQVFTPTEQEKAEIKSVTRQYHAVSKNTYKKWLWVNRVSIILEFCTETFEIKKKFVVQDDNEPIIKDLSGAGLFFYQLWFKLLSLSYKLPEKLYRIIWRCHAFQVKKTWRLGIAIFHLKQLGLVGFSNKVLSYVNRRKRK